MSAAGGEPSGPGPLAGRRVLVTRRSPLTASLAALGAHVIEAPAIDTVPPEDWGPLDAALHALSRYDWLAVTSANAVRFVRERLDFFGLALPTQVKVASVGPATTRALRDAFPGRSVTLEPASDFRAEGLADAFGAVEVAGHWILLPISDRARDVLPARLRARGALVDVVVAYRTVANRAPETLAAAMAERPDLVVFASPSAVESFVAIVGDAARGLRAAVLGPITEAAARDAGLAVVATAHPSTLEGLEAAVLAYLATRS